MRTVGLLPLDPEHVAKKHQTNDQDRSKISHVSLLCFLLEACFLLETGPVCLQRLEQLLVAYGGGFPSWQDHNINSRIIPFNDGPGIATGSGFIHRL